MGTQNKIRTSYHIAAIIFCTILYCMLFTSQAQAETAYRTWEGEPINGYTLSREYEDDMYYLVCSKKGQDAVVLDESYYYWEEGTAAEGQLINEAFITNGKTIYYSITDFNDDGLTTIYKISVKGKGRTKVKTVKKGYWLRLITLYDGKLYYSYNGDDDYLTYEYNMKTKRTKRIFKGKYVGESGYGANIIMSEPMGNGMENRKCFSYNVKTKKKYSLPSSMFKFVASDGIYYERFTTKNGSMDKYNLYKCSFKGTNKKKLLSFGFMSGDYITEMNRKFIKYKKNGKGVVP